MKTTLLLIFFLFSITGINCQNLPILKPKIGTENIYSKDNQMLWQKSLNEYYELISGSLDYELLSEKSKVMIDSLENGYGPLTQSSGCSWYCGGGPYKVSSDSHLEKVNNITYYSENLHDFDLFTAWVPDKKKNNIGEKINFYFKPFSPRVEEIIIWNGYIKNIDLWRANSRVSKLRLIVDGKPIAILELEDITNVQTFKIDPIQSEDENLDLILTLEILEIYPGEKYSDVAISEINFNGLDVHCFAAGTKITMSDKSLKNIELILAGDKIVTFNFEKGELEETAVSKLVKARHKHLYTITLENYNITVTDDHPFWIENKGWASLNPVKSNNNYLQDSKVELIKIGDKIFIPEKKKYVPIISISRIEKDQITYSIELESGNNFLANGLLVKTEIVKIEN